MRTANVIGPCVSSLGPPLLVGDSLRVAQLNLVLGGAVVRGSSAGDGGAGSKCQRGGADASGSFYATVIAPKLASISDWYSYSCSIFCSLVLDVGCTRCSIWSCCWPLERDGTSVKTLLEVSTVDMEEFYGVAQQFSRLSSPRIRSQFSII